MSAASATPADLRASGAVAGVALSAGLCALAFPPQGASHILWGALVPALWAIEGSRPGRASALGLLHGTLYAAAISSWLVPTVRDYFDRSAGFAIGFQILFWIATVGIYQGALFGALSFLRRSLPRWVWLALVPLAFAAADLARTSLGLRSPWARLGDAFYQAERLRQLAGVTGVYGLTALVVLGNLTGIELVRAIASLRNARERALLPAASLAGCFLLLLGGALAYGDQRLATLAAAREQSEAFDVALVQGNVASSLRWRRSQASTVLRRYAGLTRQALREREGLDLVIWPEQALQTAPDDEVYGPPLRAFVDAIETPLLIGAPRHERDREAPRVYNAAFLLRPGQEVLHYDKLRLLPFSETRPIGLGAARGDLDAAAYAAGNRPGVFEWEGPTLGVLICFEAVYPEMARALAKRDARVLVNIANDGWFRGRGGRDQHLAQVVFRSIETGLPMLRASTTGITAAVGPDGTVRGRIDRDDAQILRARLDIAPLRPPIYLRIGDAFALASAAALAVCGVVAVVARRGRSGLAASDVQDASPPVGEEASA